MGIRLSTAHLAIGCAHLGISDRILKVLQVYAKYYNAKVYHLGQLITLEEKKMMEYRLGKVRTFDKVKKELGVEEFRKQYGSRYKDATQGVAVLRAAQDNRIRTLKAHFKDLSLVINDEQYYDSDLINTVEHVGHDLALSQHIRLESLSANGDKVSGSPITDRSFHYFRGKGCSAIVPHPNPVVESFNREGLNQSYQFLSSGGLQETQGPKRASEYYKAYQAPAAVLIMIDDENGEYHAKRIKFDYFRDDNTHRQEPAIIDDGLLFMASGIFRLVDGDKGQSITDTHAKYQHNGVVATLRDLNERHHGETLVHNGDVGDWPSASRHLAQKPLYKEGVRFSDDADAYFALLDSISRGFPHITKKVVVDSNHDVVWLNNYIAAHPELKGTCDWATLKKRAPEWDIMEVLPGEDKTFYFGDLAFRHGHKEAGVKGAVKIFRKVILGHWHKWVEYGDGASMGAGCGLGPAYLENGTTSWVNTITSLSKFRGIARFNIKIVLHTEAKRLSRYAYRNKIYEIKW